MTTPLINRAKVKEMALKLSNDVKHGKFTRVSSEFLELANAQLDAWIRNRVTNHPSVGKTLK